MILTIFVIFTIIQHVSSIQCYTCLQPDGFCSLPLNLDHGDESNESDIESMNYDSGYVCQSEHYFDLNTGTEKLILRGIEDCEELNIPNHRIYCCNEDNCNRWIPPIMTKLVIYSNDQRYLPSMMLILISLIFQCFY